MKTIVIFLITLYFYPLYCDEVQQISFHELSETYREKKIEIRGFIYRTKEGVAILAPQPDLKSCCVGSSQRSNEQIILKDLHNFPETVQAVSMRGTLYFDPDTKQRSLIGSQLLESKKKYPLITLGIFVGIFLISFILVKKRP